MCSAELSDSMGVKGRQKVQEFFELNKQLYKMREIMKGCINKSQQE